MIRDNDTELPVATQILLQSTRRSPRVELLAAATERENPIVSARATGRAGEGDPLFAAGASLALLDAHLRRDPPAAGALRKRLALMSAAASAKILRLNADEAALRDVSVMWRPRATMRR